MRQRCSGRHTHSKNYSDRGIVVCERWGLFSNFISDMGHRPEGTTLDRIDNDGVYEPSNCRWATRQQQAANRSSHRMIEYKGINKFVSEWARELGIGRVTLSDRIAAGWPLEKAFTKDAHEYHKRSDDEICEQTRPR